MKIGLMGFEFSSPNKGCEALVYSFMSIIKNKLKESDTIINFTGTNVGNIPLYYPNIQYVTVVPKLKDIKFRFIKTLKECDIIFDVTMGDSFSDIYSKKYYDSLIIQKKLAEFFCKKYILLPQTYGPFYERNSAIKAKSVLRRATRIYCRDELSQKMLLDSFNVNSKLSSDMAFVLPYDKNAYTFSQRNKIGINISGLLYRGGFDSPNQFELKLDYKQLINQLIEALSVDYEVHLISHVIDLKENAHDDDYCVCKQLHETFPNTILAPAFNSPIEAKSYISNMNLFIGSRMHSTIAAFSSGVITIPISYSRKFEGLFGSLKYPYVVNAREECTDSAFRKILNFIEKQDELKMIQDTSMRIVDEKNAMFKTDIYKVIDQIR